jgi:hypothetical protein
MKIVENLPEPPEITSEIKKQLAEESKVWTQEFRKKVREIEYLTPYDLMTRIR